MPNFSSPDKVQSVLDTMLNAEVARADNRALLNRFFNGAPPWTKDEARENRIIFNLNDKSGCVLLHSARAQYENALMKQGVFFRLFPSDAPPDKQKDWAAFVTLAMNKPVMNSNAFYHTQDSVFGGVCLHGVGAKIWWDESDWRPRFMGVQDILIPTDTELTMDNLTYFAVRRRMRPGELFKHTFAKNEKNIDQGWNLKIVRKLLDEYKNLNQNPQNADWSTMPERMIELYKQNQNYYDGDSAPVIWLWDFFHREEDAPKPGWYRKILLDKGCVPSSISDEETPNPFIYKSRRVFARDLSNIIHFQFGDGNNVPPFMYHSIRSLAFLTYELLWTLNRLRCQWTQHVFEQMLTLFRIQDPADRSRLDKIYMQSPWGIIPEGLAFVPAAERYTVDANLVTGLRQEYEDLVGEATSSYTQRIDSGTSKERTKFEVQAMLQQISALMASLLSRAYRQEHYAYQEIARRFFLKDSQDFDVKKFRQKCLQADIPEKWLDIDRWEVEVEQKLGGGNRMLELAEAAHLMEHVNQFEPDSQQEVKHDFVLAVTNNPKKAMRLVPLEQKSGGNDAEHDAELAFGALLQGSPVRMKEGLNHIDQVETLLKLMQGQLGLIARTGGVGTPKELIGMHLAALYTQQHIAVIAQDPAEKARVKAYGDMLGRIMNEVKAMEQRQQEATTKGNGERGVSPEAQAKIAGEVIKAKAKANIQTASAAQRRRHRDLDFAAEQHRRNLETIADINREHARSLAEHRTDAIKRFEQL